MFIDTHFHFEYKLLFSSLYMYYVPLKEAHPLSALYLSMYGP